MEIGLSLSLTSNKGVGANVTHLLSPVTGYRLTSPVTGALLKRAS